MAGFVPDFSAEQGTMCHVFVYWSYGFCLFTSGKRPGQQLIVIQHVKFQIPCLQVYRPVNSTVIRVIYGTLCKELGILCVVEITSSLLWISGGYKQKWNYCGSCDDKMKRLLLHLDFEF